MRSHVGTLSSVAAWVLAFSLPDIPAIPLTVAQRHLSANQGRDVRELLTKHMRASEPVFPSLVLLGSSHSQLLQGLACRNNLEVFQKSVGKISIGRDLRTKTLDGDGRDCK